MIQRRRMHMGEVRVTFVLPEDAPAGEVSLVGDFNDWDPTANPLTGRSKKSRRTAVVLEADRRYVFRYRFADGSWLNDAEADDFEPSGFGSDNSVILT